MASWVSASVVWGDLIQVHILHQNCSSQLLHWLLVDTCRILLLAIDIHLSKYLFFLARARCVKPFESFLLNLPSVLGFSGMLHFKHISLIARNVMALLASSIWSASYIERIGKTSGLSILKIGWVALLTCCVNDCKCRCGVGIPVRALPGHKLTNYDHTN